MSPAATSGRTLVLLLGSVLLVSAALLAPASAQDANETGTDGNETAPDANETAGEGNATGEGTGGAGGGAATGGDGIPADAPAPEEGRITRILTFGVIEENCPGGAPAPCWDVLNLVANPGDVVVLRADLTNSPGFHNLHIIEPGAEPVAAAPGPKTQLGSNLLHVASYTVPESGELTFICDAHEDTMVGHVVTPEAALATAGHASVPSMGVHFLAYWVGVIAFAILFIVYGITFFLFKYNETRATTDHWDRSDPASGSTRLAAVAPIVAVVIAVVAIAAITYVTMR